MQALGEPGASGPDAAVFSPHVFDLGGGDPPAPSSSDYDENRALADIFESLRRSSSGGASGSGSGSGSGRAPGPTSSSSSSQSQSQLVDRTNLRDLLPEPPSFGRLLTAAEDQKRAAVTRELSRCARGSVTSLN